MTVTSRLLDYSLDGKQFQGYLARDEAAAGPRPAVLIAPTWAGRGEFEEGKARKLAEAGYIALALDMYGDGLCGTGPEENAALMAPLLADRADLQARINAGLAAAAALEEVDASRIAAIGYCFGGLCVLDLARSGADVRGVVSLHGLFTPADNVPAPTIRSKVLCLHGYDDPMAQPDSVLALASELTTAGADWQIHAYGNTVHAFTNPAADDPDGGTAYSPVADRRSWLAMQNFFDEVLA
ncbi:dienelactone hydrolase family protein [Pseudohalioglobus lutimaris]|uniref:Dienelactone hydrolase family protein n=1 Tax=Pseudohalioglobus lutimaris TaxID=1737061 RepID=A0A2N5X6U2_9GAMM|nr:dienelactone hydrolase family protein [Pseudohalioglobus lutimaris]PLW70201.1 dienelactone hydrolase family protein [Pseudohalioglobus lutimaris]